MRIRDKRALSRMYVCTHVCVRAYVHEWLKILNWWEKLYLFKYKISRSQIDQSSSDWLQSKAWLTLHKNSNASEVVSVRQSANQCNCRVVSYVTSIRYEIVIRAGDTSRKRIKGRVEIKRRPHNLRTELFIYYIPLHPNTHGHPAAPDRSLQGPVVPSLWRQHLLWF